MEQDIHPIIEKTAEEFVNDSLEKKESADDFVNKIRIRVLKYTSDIQQLTFLTAVSQITLEKFETLSKSVENPYRSSELSEVRDKLFFINQLLDEFGFGLRNETVFERELQRLVSLEIHSFLSNYNDDEDERQVAIYHEISSLQNLFFLGKGLWRQILRGKIEELESQRMIDSKAKDALRKLIKMVE